MSDRHWQAPPDAQEEAWGLQLRGLAWGEEPGREGAGAGPWRLQYVVRGEALLELPGRRPRLLEAGDLLLRRAAQGRLRPRTPGCRAHRLDFGGAWMERWVEGKLFGTLPCLLRAGFDEALMGHLVRLADLARHGPRGAERLMGGELALLLARIQVALEPGEAPRSQPGLVRRAALLLGDAGREHERLESLAEELGVSYSWFRRSFSRQTGQTPRRFRHLQRLDRACRLLADTTLTVKAIAKELGYSSPAYFTLSFRREMGMPPSLWRRNLPEGSK